MAANLSPQEINQLKARVHAAAKDGMAISIFALLWNMDKAIVKEILDYQTEHDGQLTTPLIIAAMQGEAKVVQVLLSNFEVDIEQRSTVRFDGYVIQEATALWCASGAGHMDIVEMLIKNGAEVNNSTATNSTPLRAACFDGRLDIVKYLLEHGADLTIPNKYDNTCLMISCYKGHAKVVRHLLEKGADPDLKAHCGATALHFGAECGHLDVVKELVHFGAKMVENSLKMTPLMVAAECGKEEIVTYLIKQPEVSREKRIEAMELLGASFANDKETYNLTKTFEYLKEAMMMRMYDTRRTAFCAYTHRLMILPKPEFPPVPAYGYHVESQNMQDLSDIRNNQDALHMEALTIRERILGSSNPEIPHPVIFRGAVFADNGRFDRCIALWIHALVLRQSHNRSIAKDLLRFSQVFAQMVSLRVELDFERVSEVLTYGLKELEGFQKESSDDCESKSSAMELYQANILSVIYLIRIGMRVLWSRKHDNDIHKLVYRFLKMRPCLKNGYTPLHIVVDPGICVDDFHVNNIVVFPNKYLVDIFVECGADLDAMDSGRNSVLHIIVKAILPESKESVRQEIIQALLKAGAHCDIVNCKKETPFTFANARTLKTLNTYGNVTLRCLASKCLRAHSIPFKGQIPTSLESFVELH